MTKKYRVTVTMPEREELAALLSRGRADVRKLKHAQVLLHADEGEAAGDDGDGPGWPRCSACGSALSRTAWPRR